METGRAETVMSTEAQVVDAIVPHPSAPATLEEAGISLDLTIQLVLKTLFFAGELSGSELARRLGVGFPVVEPALEQLKWHHHCEIAGGAMLGGAAYRYRITDAGRSRAALFLERNHYVGVAPVPLQQYQDYMRRVRDVAPRSATRARVRWAFSHLVLSHAVLDQLGPAINSRHSLFVYGPPGNGKTVISQAIRGLLDGHMAVPHAIEVEGQIIRFFDQVVHERLESPSTEQGLDQGHGVDRRWVRCRRPLFMVGGELQMDQLELSYNPAEGFYRAPVQALANGGVLVIDDFGRQACSPQQLLNRWIVPLGSRVDYLTLQTGQKFELPFAVLVVFATNIKPAELVDEAFLRRIHYKVFVESPSVDQFAEIFERCCRDRSVPYERTLVDEMLRNYYRPRRIPLRGCHPGELIDQALALAEYLGQPRNVTSELLEAACSSYFVDDREVPSTYA